MAMIEAHELTRSFGGVTAVNGLAFEVPRGEIFGFLGPNGAGKTTTIKMLCTLLRPTAGTAVINGHDVRRAPHCVRQSIGIVFQEPTLDSRFTGIEHLWFHAMVYGVSRNAFVRRSQRLLQMVELTDKAGLSIRNYSGGMKRRLELARGLIHQPEVLFLDEPTIGLDAQTRRHVWRYVRELSRSHGITVFMTTHYLEEAEHCDRIAVIDRGRLAALDTPRRLKASVGADRITVVTSDNVRAAERLTRMSGRCARFGSEGEMIVETPDGDRFIAQMIEILRTVPALEVRSVRLTEPTLDQVFIRLTGHAMHGADG
jgi:ABC-2 type transport system ATP-binding protein